MLNEYLSIANIAQAVGTSETNIRSWMKLLDHEASAEGLPSGEPSLHPVWPAFLDKPSLIHRGCHARSTGNIAG